MKIDSNYDITSWRRPRVLVVDDEVGVRYLLEKVLHDAGYVVVTVKSGIEALEVLESDPELDLLITDVIMRPMNGIELAQRIGEIKPGVPVLFTSGYSEYQRGKAELPENAQFVEKPFSPAEVLERASKMLGPDKKPYPW